MHAFNVYVPGAYSWRGRLIDRPANADRVVTGEPSPKSSVSVYVSAPGSVNETLPLSPPSSEGATTPMSVTTGATFVIVTVNDVAGTEPAMTCPSGSAFPTNTSTVYVAGPAGAGADQLHVPSAFATMFPTLAVTGAP